MKVLEIIFIERLENVESCIMNTLRNLPGDVSNLPQMDDPSLSIQFTVNFRLNQPMPI